MKELNIHHSSYYMSTINAKSPCKDLYIYCSSCPIKYKGKTKVSKNGIAFLYEFLTYKTTTKTAYKNIMQCLDNLNLVNDIYSSYVWISVIDNTVVFTIDGINLSKPILLEEEDSVLLNNYYVQRFLNFRHSMFSKINKANNMLEIVKIIEREETYNKESASSSMRQGSVNYTYVITGAQEQNNTYNALINPTVENLLTPYCDNSVFDVAYLTYLDNNNYVSENDKTNHKNKLKAIPHDKLLNIEDFFTVNKKELTQLLKKYKINEITLFENKFIIYSSMAKLNYNKFIEILSKYNILK